jgi:hypothetical protein
MTDKDHCSVCGAHIESEPHTPACQGNHFIVEPVLFDWTREWLPRINAYDALVEHVPHDPIRILQAVTAWSRDTDDWLSTLGERKQRDVIDLLAANCAMLFETIDPSHPDASRPEHGGPIWSEFRREWFRAIPLLRSAHRIGLPGVDRVEALYAELERYAEQMEFLP